MTVRDLIERLQTAPYDGMPVVILDADGVYLNIEMVISEETVAEHTTAVIVAERR